MGSTYCTKCLCRGEEIQVGKAKPGGSKALAWLLSRRKAGRSAGSKGEQHMAGSSQYGSELAEKRQHGISFGWQQLKGFCSISNCCYEITLRKVIQISCPANSNVAFSLNHRKHPTRFRASILQGMECIPTCQDGMAPISQLDKHPEK